MSTFHRRHRGAIAALALASANALAGAARAGFDDLDRLIFVANRTAPEIDRARGRVIGQIAVAGIPHIRAL